MTRVAPIPLLAAVLLGAPPRPTPATAQTPPQTQRADYTRYELQDPGSASFRILYDVSATTPGARYYYNTIRPGAEEEVHGVTDLRTGAPLRWELVDGAYARTHGHPRAAADGRYIQVHLARPVPEGGQARIRIDKTYVDPRSAYEEEGDLVFDRTLGIPRNAVVLPPGTSWSQPTTPCRSRARPTGASASAS